MYTVIYICKFIYNYIVLYCIVLYCIVLYCIVLYCTVLYCTVLYCIVLYCIVLYCIVLYCIVLQFKQLMNKLDPSEDNVDSDEIVVTKNKELWMTSDKV